MFNNLLHAFKHYHFRSTIVKARLSRKTEREYVLDLLETDYVSREIIQDMGRQWFMKAWKKDICLKDTFYKCGFRLRIAKELADVIKPLVNTSYTVDQLFDLAFEYVSGNYEPIGKRYLFEHDIQDEWFQPTNAQHLVVNVEHPKASHILKIIEKHPVYSTSRPEHETQYFHATNWKSSKSIAENIDHRSGRQCLDFGKFQSFYCTPNLNDALQWCRKKQKVFRREACIVAFKVPKSLPYNVKMFNSITQEWVKLVQESRICNKNELDDFDFVYGPMCANADPVAYKGASPVPHNPVKYQLCSKSKRADQYLQQHMLGIVYLSKN